LLSDGEFIPRLVYHQSWCDLLAAALRYRPYHKDEGLITAIAHSQHPPQPGVRKPCLKAEVGAIRLSVNSHRAIAHSQGPPQPGVRNPCLIAEVGAIRLSVNSHMAIAHSQGPPQPGVRNPCLKA
jgi:hypothetical protein